MLTSQSAEIHSNAFSLNTMSIDGHVIVSLKDLQSGFEISDSPYAYKMRCPINDGVIETTRLSQTSIELDGDGESAGLTIKAKIAGFELEHTLVLLQNAPVLTESITLHNRSATALSIETLSYGFQRALTNDVGHLMPELGHDRFVAIPFRHKPSDAHDHNNDFAVHDLLTRLSPQLVVNEFAALPFGHGFLPTKDYRSEGWAWRHGSTALGIFKFNQSAIEFSALTVNRDMGGAKLQFGGASLQPDENEPPMIVQPGESLHFGITHIQAVDGELEHVSYAFREFLDRNGCVFPGDFNPPVHWNEIYDNAEYILGSPGQPPQPRMTRRVTFTRELILREAAKAEAYHCEALYLDPGWDTDFATFLWGDDWLGDCVEFVDEVKTRYGLQVSLHTPLAPWLSLDGRGVSSWPQDARRLGQAGNIIYRESAKSGRVATICLGSQQYLDEAERRLHALCEAGVTFLMFDGNWWQGECWDASHGHPIPYTKEVHCRANLELARRVHAKYPHVLIEMHDMITGGSILRYTPVYYKYGLPGSYDSNWGFELMWQPMEDIRSGKARALYYYNLACNVPIYLHVDLRADNINALVFWWYASTCRHLGIGGTHDNPVIAEAHKHAMKRYRELERFFKRGNFYGANEEVHFHVLPEENAFVVTLFNLSDESRIITGTIAADLMGLDLNRWYVVPYSHAEGGFSSDTGTYRISRRLDPWAAQIAVVRPLEPSHA